MSLNILAVPFSVVDERTKSRKAMGSKIRECRDETIPTSYLCLHIHPLAMSLRPPYIGYAYSILGKFLPLLRTEQHNRHWDLNQTALSWQNGNTLVC